MAATSTPFTVRRCACGAWSALEAICHDGTTETLLYRCSRGHELEVPRAHWTEDGEEA